MIIARMSITVLLLLGQITLILILLNRVITFFPFLVGFAYLISFIVVFVLIKKDKPSAYKITWIILAMVIPILGGVLYLLFGDKRPVKKIAAHMKEHALIAKALDEDKNLPDINEMEDLRRANSFEYVRRASSYHAYENTQVKYFPMGELMFEAILEELSQAKKFILLEFFIIKKSQMWDKICEILVRKASEGVEVRLIVDDLGSLKLFTPAYVSQLTKLNIKVIRFNPIIPVLSLFMNNRDHRKIIVIDGHTAFNGGINISDEYINLNSPYVKDPRGIWKDTGLRLKGDAVWSFTLMFIEVWDTFCKKGERMDDFEFYRYKAEANIESDGFVLPYGDTPLDGEHLGENIYIDILNQANKYVYIFTPFLIISEKMIYALQMAQKRGVDVRIVTPFISDWGTPGSGIIHRVTRSYYGYLLKEGIRIYEYTPGFMHAKCFISDDEVAIVGTINLDYRSLYLHFECATLLYKSSAIMDIKDDFLKTMIQSHEIIGDNRHIARKVVDAILHLFAPLM